MSDVRDEISEASRAELLQAALELADVCRGTIATMVGSGFEVSTKADDSLVTTADVETERVFREQVRTRFPDMGVTGEELGQSDPQADFQWIIDPIDGTAEFARQVPLYGSIIALHYKARPLVGVIDHPALALRCHAAHGLGAFANGKRLSIADCTPAEAGPGVRLGLPSRASFNRPFDDGPIYHALIEAQPNFRVYHTCYSHTLTAMSALDAAMEWDTPAWDLAATRILVEEAGGRYECLQERNSPDGERIYSAVFGKPTLVDNLATLIKGHL